MKLTLLISTAYAQYWYNSNYNVQLYTTIPNLTRAGHQCVGMGVNHLSQMLCFGGFNSTGNVTQTVYSTTTNTLTTATSTMLTRSKNATTTTMAPQTTQAGQSQFITNSYIVNNIQTTMAVNDLIRYSHVSRSWSVVRSNGPFSRAHHVMVAHGSGSFALLHGGLSYQPNEGSIERDGLLSNSAVILQDIWLVDFDSLQWTQLSSNGPSLWMHSMVYDPVRDAFLIHGGMLDAAGTQSNGTYRIRIDATTKSLIDIVQLTPMPIYVSQHTMSFYKNPTTGSQFFVLFGGVSTFPAATAGAATNTLWIFQCLNGLTSNNYEGCTWVQQASGQGTANRFGHDAAINAVSGQLIVVGGVQGSSVVNSVVILSIVSDNYGQWYWTSSPSKQLQQQTALHTLTIIQADVNTTQLVRFGGMDAVYPIQDESLGIQYYGSFEVGYFSYGVPEPLPVYVIPPIPKLPAWTDGNISTVNITINTISRNLTSGNSTFATQIQSTNAIIAGSTVGGVLVFMMLSMFIYVRFINPSYAKNHTFFKFMAPGDEAAPSGDD